MVRVMAPPIGIRRITNLRVPPIPRTLLFPLRLPTGSLSEASEAEQFVTLQIPLEFSRQWISPGYTHLHFGVIRLALIYHGRKGLHVVAHMALLDTRFLEYQHACIGTIETTLNMETIFVTLFPNFNMALSDSWLLTALKVQLQIIGAPQVQDFVAAILHYHMAYRVQNHALDLSLTWSEEALIIYVDSMNAPTCVHVLRQISRADLVKLLLENGVTNYERLHQNAQPIQSYEPKFGKKPDGKVVITFNHRPIQNPELFAPSMFHTMMMMRPQDEGLRDNPKEAKKDADPKADPDADAGLSIVQKKKKVLPCYKPILKWVRKQKWENPEKIREYLRDMVLASIYKRLVHKMEQKGKIAVIPQAAPGCMFHPTSPSYEEQFPQLGQFTNGDGRHIHAFKVPNPNDRDERGNSKFVIRGEAFLN
ncbi:hypothetical protein CRG98_035444 [Punica granatum]|uniref:Uncharacterized protein n=1 Tax=Punica granatum TaxID=22663 RepID=A0A2I0IJE7_PUNGR|nr:hypothetical protein CRG98_035444 [Punica granatum]